MTEILLKPVIFIFYRVKISENQLSLLLTERKKKFEGCKRLSWRDLAKMLNAEGPFTKTAVGWKSVNMKT